MSATASAARISIRAGVLTLETQKMPLKRATAFARMVERNPKSPALMATVERVGAAKLGQFVVCFVPGNPAKQQKMAADFQAEQQARCDKEYSTWEFRGDAQTLRTVELTTFDIDDKTGEVKPDKPNVYTVTETSCTCPHFTGRLRALGFDCKHICGWKRKRREVRAKQRRNEDGTPFPTIDEIFADTLAKLDAARALIGGASQMLHTDWSDAREMTPTEAERRAALCGAIDAANQAIGRATKRFV